jgi:hypothetical protein
MALCCLWILTLAQGCIACGRVMHSPAKNPSLALTVFGLKKIERELTLFSKAIGS